jgi:hypothetical protein
MSPILQTGAEGYRFLKLVSRARIKIVLARFTAKTQAGHSDPPD